MNSSCLQPWLVFLFFFEFLNFIYFLYSRFLLVIYFIHISVYMSIPISQFIPPPPPAPLLSPLGVHTFVLYICVSIPGLQGRNRDTTLVCLPSLTTTNCWRSPILVSLQISPVGRLPHGQSHDQQRQSTVLPFGLCTPRITHSPSNVFSWILLLYMCSNTQESNHSIQLFTGLIQ